MLSLYDRLIDAGQPTDNGTSMWPPFADTCGSASRSPARDASLGCRRLARTRRA